MDVIYSEILCSFGKKGLYLRKYQKTKSMPPLASLTLNGHNYDVRLLDQNFDLSTSWRGDPRQLLASGGQLCILMDTPADNFILELMLGKEEDPTVEGSLEICDGTSDLPIRRIQFSKAYITKYQETFDLLKQKAKILL